MIADLLMPSPNPQSITMKRHQSASSFKMQVKQEYGHTSKSSNGLPRLYISLFLLLSSLGKMLNNSALHPISNKAVLPMVTRIKLGGGIWPTDTALMAIPACQNTENMRKWHLILIKQRYYLRYQRSRRNTVHVSTHGKWKLMCFHRYISQNFMNSISDFRSSYYCKHSQFLGRCISFQQCPWDIERNNEECL